MSGLLVTHDLEEGLGGRVSRQQLKVHDGKLQQSDFLGLSEEAFRVAADPDVDLEHDFQELIKGKVFTASLLWGS